MTTATVFGNSPRHGRDALILVLFLTCLPIYSTVALVSALCLNPCRRWHHWAVIPTITSGTSTTNRQRIRRRHPPVLHNRSTQNNFHESNGNINKDSDDDLSRLQQALFQQSQQQQQQKHQQSNNVWYLERNKPLPFECTMCGKCCRTKGSVYMSPREIAAASHLLNMSAKDFIAKFATHTISNNVDDTDHDAAAAAAAADWIRLANNDEGACVFLEEETNQCRIYEARPVQCHTYPFWPNIMKSRNDWNDEVRLPDEAPKKSWTIPYWSAELGGCEGMQWITKNEDTSTSTTGGGVLPLEAHQRRLEYERAERLFPRGKLQPLSTSPSSEDDNSYKSSDKD